MERTRHLELKTWPRFHPVSLSLSMDRLTAVAATFCNNLQLNFTHIAKIIHYNALQLHPVITPPLLALASLDDATQIGSFLFCQFAQGGQGK